MVSVAFFRFRKGGEGAADLLAVVEMPFLVADDLVGLVPLARDEEDVAGPREHHGRADRLGPVGDAQVAHRGVEPGRHLVENRLGRLVAGIVRSEDGRRGVFHGDLRHLGPFRAVAVAAAAAHREQLLRRGAQLADRPQHVLQRIGRMGVVHHL